MMGHIEIAAPTKRTVELSPRPHRPTRTSLIEQRLKKLLRRPAFNKIVTDICRRRGMNPLLVAGHSRQHDIVLVRNEVFDALYRAGYSFTTIGVAFGKDHTTVIHGVRRHRGEPVKKARKAAIMAGEFTPSPPDRHRPPPVYFVKSVVEALS